MSTHFTKGIKFLCPICQSPLTINDKTWLCDGSQNQKNTKHPFDVARQGYVNLLPVHSKKNKNPGDSQASILARQRFLQAGFYQPLQETIATLLIKYLSTTATNTTWLDIGCGEGYYSQKIAHIDKITNLLAIDISKPAVLELAKSAKRNQLLWSQINDAKTDATCSGNIIPIVASASQLPIADGSMQGVSSIFSPILPDELARVLITDGILLIAKPDVGHLASVRFGLFEYVREHNSDKFLEQLSVKGFELLHSEKVSHEFGLNHEQLADLLTMTPYSYRAKRENREALLQQAERQGFRTQARFVVYVLQKKV